MKNCIEMSSLSKRELNAELSVWGYIRKNYAKCTNIPVELIRLCLQMYLIKVDVWSKTLSDNLFTINKDRLLSVTWQFSTLLLGRFGGCLSISTEY